MPEDPASSRPTREELYEEFDAAIADEEFESYRHQEADLRERFEGEIGRLRDELSGPAEKMDRSRLRPAGWTYWNLRRVTRPLGLLLVTIVGAVLVIVSGGGVSPFDDRTLGMWFVVVVGTGGLFFAFFLTSSISAHRGDVRLVEELLEVAESTYNQERARLVREAVRRQVTDLFRESGVITFPMLAPTLVELSNAKITSSRTHQEVIDFIQSHETSAIGIAGSRGSGKTTLMEAVRNADGLASHHVHITAPVKYEPLDFTRRLFAEVARTIVTKSGHPVESAHAAHRRRFMRQRMVRDVFTLAVLCVLAGVTFLWGLDNYDWTWDWRTTVGFAGAAVLVAVISATVVSLGRSLSRSSDVRSALFDAPRSVRLAAEALDDLVWSREEGQRRRARPTCSAGCSPLAARTV